MGIIHLIPFSLLKPYLIDLTVTPSIERQISRVGILFLEDDMTFLLGCQLKIRCYPQEINVALKRIA